MATRRYEKLQVHVPLDQSKPGQLTINGRRFRGRIFQAGGTHRELYKIGALAAALGKTTNSIEKWEDQKVFPMPLYTIRGDNVGLCRRWYSREQIINIHAVIGLIPYGRGNGHRHLRQPFFNAVKKVFAYTTLVNLSKKDVPTDDKTTHSYPGRVSAKPATGHTGRPDRSLTRPVHHAGTPTGGAKAVQRPVAPKYNPSIRG